MSELKSLNNVRNSLQYLESGSVKNQMVVFFHGYGASAADLYPLSIELKTKAHFIFPQGPLQIPIGGGFSGRAWFPVDLEAHERAQRLGEELDYSGKSARSIEPIVQRCVDFIEKINEAQKPLVIGGFSQGAMLATQLILALPRPPKALVILSGTIFDRVHLESGFSSRNDFVYFQSHGRSDEVLPFSGAERLHEVLDAAGVHGEFIEFKGGHDIPMTVIQKLDRFLGGLAFSK